MATTLKDLRSAEQGDKDTLQFPVAKFVGLISLLGCVLSVGVVWGETKSTTSSLAIRLEELDKSHTLRIDKVEHTEIELMRIIMEMNGDMKEVKSMIKMHMGTEAAKIK